MYILSHVNVETLTTGIALFSSVFAAYFSSFYRIPNVSITINRMGTLAGDMLAGWFYTFVGVWWMIYMFKRLFNCQNSNSICISTATYYFSMLLFHQFHKETGSRHGRDRFVVGFKTTCAISADHH